MSFKYVNPGYAELLDKNLIKSTIKSQVYNPTNGVAFYQTTSKKGVTLSSYPTIDLYFKFDLYTTSGSSNFRFGYPASNSGSYVQGLRFNNGKILVECNSNSLGNGISINYNQINKIWCHIHLTGNYQTSKFKISVNGQEENVSIPNASYGSSFATINLPYVIYSGSQDMLISNVIISDEYINPKEEVIILPTSATETDMTDNQDGTYTASESGQTLLQAVNTTELIAQYGRGSKVTSIASAGIPAYNTTGALKLVGIDKISGSVTEHDTIAVGANDSVGVYDLWNVNNLTLDDLNGKQIGWKAAT